jgi:hypothetical protein
LWLIRRPQSGAKNFFPFLWVYFLQELARAVGEWQGFLGDFKHRKERADG